MHTALSFKFLYSFAYNIRYLRAYLFAACHHLKIINIKRLYYTAFCRFFKRTLIILVCLISRACLLVPKARDFGALRLRPQSGGF